MKTINRCTIPQTSFFSHPSAFCIFHITFPDKKVPESFCSHRVCAPCIFWLLMGEPGDFCPSPTNNLLFLLFWKPAEMKPRPPTYFFSQWGHTTSLRRWLLGKKTQCHIRPSGVYMCCYGHALPDETGFPGLWDPSPWHLFAITMPL